MRVAVFRGHLTINHQTDTSEEIVNRLKAFGHEVLHVTAVAQPGQVIPVVLKRDMISPELMVSFDPQALAIIIPSPDHEYFPLKVIDATLGAGGTVVYIGPANYAKGESPVSQFLAQRGFFFQSISPKGPQPLRCGSSAWVHLPWDVLAIHQGALVGAFDGVYFLEVRTPYVLASQSGQTPILDVPAGRCCTWSGTPLPKGMERIAVMREARGREILVTGDWLSPSSLAIMACNIQFIVNLLAGPGSKVIPLCSESPSIGQTILGPHAKTTLMISSASQSWPFVDLVTNHLKSNGFGVIASCDDSIDLSDRIPGTLSAFVSIIDRDFPTRQDAETNAALAANRNNPDGFRLIPINFLPDLASYRMKGALRKLSEWVWLPGQDSLEWKRILALLVRVLNRPCSSFAWSATGNGRRTFVSYSFRNYDFASTLSHRLAAIGFDVCVSDETTLMNSALREQLTHLIAECDIFIPVITPEYRNSNWCYVETEIATKRFSQTAKPQIVLYAMNSERIPYWCNGFPVCRDLEELERNLHLS